MIITITANWRPTRQRISFCDLFGLPPRSILISPSKSTIVTAPTPVAPIRLLSECIFVGSPATNMARLKRAGRRSIAAQKTFEIVHFLARPGGIAEPAAEFLKHTPGAFAGG